MARQSAKPPDQATVYAMAVVAGKVPCGRFVRLAAERHLRDQKDGRSRGLRWDREAAELAIAFFAKLCHSKGQWAGQSFALAPWQAFIVGSLWGWMRADGTRRFRVAYDEVPRKNGKSTMSCGVGLRLAYFDGEAGAEVYCAATKRDQARIVFDEAVRMVNSTPALKRRLTVYAGSIVMESNASKLQPLSADHDTMDGLNIHGVIIDELHAHKTSAIVDVLETATGARQQPLQFEITTAGHDRSSICWQHHDYSIKVLEGTVVDDAWFAFIACADPGDDWREPATWAKANPNLGVSVSIDDLRRKALKAQHIPAQQNAFRRLHLNEWTEQAERWLDMDVWAGGGEVSSSDVLRARQCFAGLRTSSTHLSSLVLLFPDDDGGYDVRCRFWFPRGALKGLPEATRVQLQEWASQGHITLTDGTVADYDAMEAAVVEIAAQHDLQVLAYDNRSMNAVVAHLEKVWGTKPETTPYVLAPLQREAPPACVELERLLLAGKLRHGNDPVLRWMASSAAVKVLPEGNVRLEADASADNVTGMTALVLALVPAMVRPAGDTDNWDGTVEVWN